MGGAFAPSLPVPCSHTTPTAGRASVGELIDLNMNPTFVHRRRRVLKVPFRAQASEEADRMNRRFAEAASCATLVCFASCRLYSHISDRLCQQILEVSLRILGMCPEICARGPHECLIRRAFTFVLCET